jgi:hypothetical protein
MLADMRNVCSVDGCESFCVGRGLCRKHYSRLRRKGSTDDVRKNGGRVCTVDGCDKPRVGQGLCDNHYRQVRQREQRLVVKMGDGRRCGFCAETVDPARRRRGPVSYCSQECKAKAYIADGRGATAVLKSYYKQKYGLTMDEVAAMRATGCAICGATEGGGRHGQLHIDHCHASGRVRGALCDSCNTGLGKFRDRPDLLIAAARYLTQ